MAKDGVFFFHNRKLTKKTEFIYYIKVEDPTRN